MKKSHIFATAALIAVVALVGGILQHQLHQGETAQSTTQIEARTALLINNIRAAHHLHHLAFSFNLQRAARYHSADMQRRKYFEHERPGESFGQRMARYVHATFLAENIAWGTGGFGTAKGIVSLWMASPGHRDNILRPGLRKIGVGIAHGSFFGQKNAVITTADFSS